MHMADALISPTVGGAFWLASAGLAAYSAKKIADQPNDRDVPLMGVMGSFVFAAQMINFAIPGTGSSGHLGGGLLLAMVLGPYRGFLVMASVLLVQALFFADGGLLALGCNIFNLGFFTCFLAYPLIVRPILAGRPTRGRLAAASLAGAVLALQFGAFGVVLETVFSGMTSLSFTAFVLLMQPIHLAIGVVEGLVTAAVTVYVWQTRPDLLDSAAPRARPAGARIPLFATLAAAALVIGCFVSWFASPDPDGLEWSLERAGAAEAAEGSAKPSGVHAALASLQESAAALPDYGFKPSGDETTDGAAAEGESWPAVSAGTSVSGLVGGALTMLLAAAAGLGVSLFRKGRD